MSKFYNIRPRCQCAFKVCVVLLASLSASLGAEPLKIAVAANFRAPMLTIAKQYEAQSDESVQITVSSSGKLYAQILQGAPFDIFFSADAVKTERLEKDQRTVPGSRFVYAQGRLVLWSLKLDFKNTESEIKAFLLAHTGKQGNKRTGKIALANPLLAPYGLAAKQSLISLGIYDVCKAQLVYGENINQAFNFTVAGGIETAFLALSQVQNLPSAQYWLVPHALHQPINQEAVLLNDSAKAREFLSFFRSAASATVIESFGYRIVDETYRK